MIQPKHFDLVTIGGGFAGLCVAVRGAELGLLTAVLEAGTDESYPCSSRWAGGISHVPYHDVKLSPDELLTAINRQTSGETDLNWRPRLPPMPAARLTGWRAEAAAFTQGGPLAGTALRWRRRAGRSPGRIGRVAGRTGCSANCGGSRWPTQRPSAGGFSGIRMPGTAEAQEARTRPMQCEPQGGSATLSSLG